MTEATPLTTFLAAAKAHALEANNPRWGRIALMADDYLGRIAAAETDGADAMARSMYGYPGPASLTSAATARTIAGDILEQAQVSMDSDDPDIRWAAAGLAAARRLIAAGTQRHDADRSLWIAYRLAGRDPRRSGRVPIVV